MTTTVLRDTADPLLEAPRTITVHDVVRLLRDEGHSLKEVAALLHLRDVHFVRRIAEQQGLTPDVLEAARRRRYERNRQAKRAEKNAEKKARKIEAGRRAYEEKLRRKWKERGWPWPAEGADSVAESAGGG